MKLRRLAINRLPGISQPFEIVSKDRGFHVVFGPNGIGKSSICRAVEALYWDDRGPAQRTSVNGEFELDGETWWAEREGSRVRWQRGGEDCAPPILPASHNHRCFFLRLRDLIDPSPDGTQDIASEIRRQMSGGFDLGQIASDLSAGVGARHGRRERTAFNETLRDVQGAEGEQLSLQRRADQLDDLKAQLEAAMSAARRLTAVERAVGLSERRADYDTVSEALAVLPDGLANLAGNEIEQIEKYQARIEGLEKRAHTLGGQLENARQNQRDTRISSPLDQAELTVWRDNADELVRVELELQSAEKEHSACRKELAAALAALGGGEVDLLDLDLDDHGQLFEFLRAVEAHNATVKANKERQRLLTRVDHTEDDERNPETLRRAVDALRSWLRAPVPETLSDRIRSRWPWIALALGMVIAGAGLAVLINPTFALLAAAGVGIAISVFLMRNLQMASDTRETARLAFEKLGTEEPEAWDITSVESRLQSLENEIAILDARSQRARDRDVELQSLKNELVGLSQEETALNAKRQTLMDSLKLNEIPPDAELVDFARALDQFRSIRIKNEGAAGKVEHLAESHTELLSDLADVLERHSEPRPNDAKSAKAYLNTLAERNSQLVQATTHEKQASEQLDLVSNDRNDARDSIKRIYSEASLNDGDLQGLTALLKTLPDYLDLKKSLARLEAQIELDRNELENAGEAELAELDGPSLERLQAELTQEANKADELRDEIADINNKIDDAVHNTNVQDLIAVREEARAKLQDRRDELLFARTAKFLIDDVEKEYEQTQLPRVFERARSHFSAFTHHNYELRLGTDAKVPRLFAIELGSGEGRGLDELSDGTRAQLLLAARIAFAEEVEQGRALPLFLDEALDQSDPERFEAIVRSLGQVANDQERQIFYLTSDPVDVGRIQDALAKEECEITAAIDLGLIRRQKASVSGPMALHIEQRPTVPEPKELSAEEYGASLGVPLLRPVLGHAEQHFFYVLSDHLELLHDFLQSGLERVGQWKTVSGTALADRLGSRTIPSQEIDYRLDLFEVFCELWKQGKGRPVDRDALENSGALSERYLDDVVAIASELDGDPNSLLDILGASKDPRLKGFRKSSLENLERFLREHSYIDDLPILSEDELRLRALASPAANKLPEGVASELLNRWWSWAAQSSNSELQ